MYVYIHIYIYIYIYTYTHTHTHTYLNLSFTLVGPTSDKHNFNSSTYGNMSNSRCASYVRTPVRTCVLKYARAIMMILHM